MRTYNQKLHSELNRRYRETNAVCPFPGKNPLRLHWRITEYIGRADNYVVTEYYGKFTPSTWTKFCRKYRDLEVTHRLFDSSWNLYDKMRTVTGGATPFAIYDMRRNPIGISRYFVSVMPNFVVGVERSMFHYLRPVKAGRYYAYSLTVDPPTPDQLTAFELRVRTTVPVLRSV